jgi:transcription elongation factor/antiterminator RfaH
MASATAKAKGRGVARPALDQKSGGMGAGPELRAGKNLALEGRERWFVAHTLPKSERKAEMHLGAQGFRTYLPEIKKTIRHARQFRNVQVPLFPRYIFLILDLARDRWLSVRSTVGVSSLFTCDGRPVPVPTGVVENLIAHSEGKLMGLDAGLTSGQSVRVLNGPFANLVGTLERLDGAGRARVLLDIMGTAAPVNISRIALSPATDPGGLR